LRLQPQKAESVLTFPTRLELMHCRIDFSPNHKSRPKLYDDTLESGPSTAPRSWTAGQQTARTFGGPLRGSSEEWRQPSWRPLDLMLCPWIRARVDPGHRIRLRNGCQRLGVLSRLQAIPIKPGGNGAGRQPGPQGGASSKRARETDQPSSKNPSRCQHLGAGPARPGAEAARGARAGS